MIEVEDAGQVMTEAINAAMLTMRMPSTDRAQFWSLVITEIEAFRARDQVDPNVIAALLRGLKTPMAR